VLGKKQRRSCYHLYNNYNVFFETVSNADIEKEQFNSAGWPDCLITSQMCLVYQPCMAGTPPHTTVMWNDMSNHDICLLLHILQQLFYIKTYIFVIICVKLNGRKTEKCKKILSYFMNV